MNKSIPALYHDLKPKMEQKNIFIAQSTFKNFLSESGTQRCDLEKRIVVIDMITEYLDPEKIDLAYEGIKKIREMQIEYFEKLLRNGHKNEFTPYEEIYNAIEKLPEYMKDFWFEDFSTVDIIGREEMGKIQLRMIDSIAKK